MRTAAGSHRRPPLARLAAAVALSSAACGAAGGPGDPPAAAAPTAATQAASAQAAHADAALATLLGVYWRPDAGVFAATDAPSSGPTGYWTSAQALDAVLDGYERTGDPRLAAVVAAAYDAQDRAGWTRDWFDDECWMALALLRAHDLLGDARYLDTALRLAGDVRANAPDASCRGTTPGGLWWDRAHTEKATAANAGAALLAARIAERTGDAGWLAFARDTYAGWRANMVDPATGAVADHLDRAGVKVWWRFTYDEGTMIGAALELWRATGDASYLADARRMAGAVLAAETRPTPLGDVLFDGAACGGDCDQFKGIGHRYLSALADADPGVPGLAALLAADAAAAWSLARDPSTGTFSVDWGGPPSAHASVSAVSAAATALSLEAARAARGAAAPVPVAP